MSQDTSSHNTIAIIGGGVSGLYCAWRLLQEERYAGKEIHVYEASPNCSGRIYTALQYQGFPIELGAARFNKQIHPMLWDLVQSFGLKTIPYGYNNRFWFLRKKKLSVTDVISGNIPYTMGDTEKGIQPDDFYRHTRINHPSTPEELNTITFKQYLNRYMSDEACTFFKDSEGYELLFNEGLSALDGIRIIEQHPDMIPSEESPWYQLQKGFGELMVTLKQQILDKGCKIFTMHRLAEVVINDTNVLLHLHDESTNGEIKSVEVDRVIFCLKRQDLEKIDMNSGDAIHDAIRSTEPIPMVKIFATYKTAWWNVFMQRDGNFCITDTPLCKVYYGPGHHLMFYSDSSTADFWQDIINQSAQEPTILQHHIQEYLSKLYKMDPKSLPEPNGLYSKYWSTGVHVWKPGVNTAAVRKLLLGTPESRIHITGEAYAVTSGWVEGAIASVHELVTTVLAPQ